MDNFKVGDILEAWSGNRYIITKGNSVYFYTKCIKKADSTASAPDDTKWEMQYTSHLRVLESLDPIITKILYGK